MSEELAFEACAELANEILEKHNIDARYTGPELLVDFVGQNFRGMMNSLQKKYNFEMGEQEFNDYVERELQAVIKTLKAKAQPCEGCNEALEKLYQSKRYGMAVVSSSAVPRVKASLQKVGQDKYIPDDLIFSAATSLPKPTSKPDPAIYLHACKVIGVEPKQCCAIEDSKSGVGSANNAGIPIIGYVGSYHGEEMQAEMEKVLKQSGAQVVMKHWNEVEKCLKEIEES